MEKGVKESQIISLNFEEIKNEPYLDYRKLNKYIEEEISKNEKNPTFF